MVVIWVGRSRADEAEVTFCGFTMDPSFLIQIDIIVNNDYYFIRSIVIIVCIVRSWSIDHD